MESRCVHRHPFYVTLLASLNCHLHSYRNRNYKSVNLQYITLGCLDDGTNESSTKSLMFQVLFFYTFYRLRALKTLYFYFCKVIKKLKNELKGFLQRILQEIMEKNNTWNIRCLVNETIVPLTQ